MLIQLFFLLCTFAVCNVNAAADRTWCFCCYVNADNNLDPYIPRNVLQMINSTQNSYELSYYLRIDRDEKRSQNPLYPYKLPFSASPQDIFIENGEAKVIKNLDEVNMDDGAVLEEFVDTCLKACPAKKRGLILWDHGAAYVGFGPDEHSIAGNDPPKSSQIGVSKIDTAVQNALKKNNLAKFDFFGYDACLMADVESIYYASQIANYYTASLELEPGHGWDYNAFRKIVLNPAVTEKEITTEIVDKFIAIGKLDKSGRTTLISIDLSKHQAFQTAIDELSLAFNDVKTDQNLLRLISRAKDSSWIPGMGTDGKDSFQLVDFAQVVKKIKASNHPSFTSFSSSFQGKVNAFLTALTDMTIHYSTDPTLKETAGISIYWPDSKTYMDYYYEENMGPYDNWKAFVATYTSLSSPVIDQLAISLTDPYSEDNIIQYYTVTGIVSPSSSVSSATLAYGSFIGSTNFVIGWVDAEIDFTDTTTSISPVTAKALNTVVSACIDPTDLNTCYPIFCYWTYTKGDNYLVSGQCDLSYTQTTLGKTSRVSVVLTYNIKTAVTNEEYYTIGTDGLKSALIPAVGDTFYPLLADKTYKYYRPSESFPIIDDGYIPLSYKFLSIWGCTLQLEFEAVALGGKKNKNFY